jgi:hypothetical protein
LIMDGNQKSMPPQKKMVNTAYEFLIHCKGKYYWNEYCTSSLIKTKYHATDLRPVFIRFGHLPEKNISMNHLTKQPEKGVSVYNALLDWINLEVIPILPSLKLGVLFVANSFCYGTVDLFHRPQLGTEYRKHCYLIEGDLLKDKGSDGEPLLANPKLKVPVQLAHRIIEKPPGPLHFP